MANLPETPGWEASIKQLEDDDMAEGGLGGIANLQATQLANRTVFLRTMLESIPDYRESTFFITPTDPTGTIAGIKATNNGDIFRVAQGVLNNQSFIYYKNDNGTAKAVADMPGMLSISNLTPLNETTRFSISSNTGEFAFAEKYDLVTIDSNGNVMSYVLNGESASLIHSEFSSLSINGKIVDPNGVMPSDAKENLLTLSETSNFSSSGLEFELNKKAWIITDDDNNVLFDVDEYIVRSATWDQAYQNSLNVEPQKTNPLAPFTTMINGKSQIRTYNVITNKEIQITSSHSNETNPRPDGVDRVVWQSDREDTAPGGLFYAALPDMTEHAYIARPKLVGWGHSFMENPVFMNTLCSLTGLYGYNFGKSSLRSNGIAARQGGAPTYYIPEGGVIPESGPINLLPNVAGPAATNGGGAMSVPPCIFAGIDGVFAWDGAQATFTRSSTGVAVNVTAPSPLYVRPITTAGVKSGAPAGIEYALHNECINIFWLGRNNIGNTDLIISNAIDMVSYLKNVGSRIVILPDFPGSGENAGTHNNDLCLTLNAALKEKFPEFYCQIDGVDLLQNFMNHHNPNYEGDIEDINNGVTPRTLRYDWLHPSQNLSGSVSPGNALHVGAEVNAVFVHEFIKNKGWL